MNSLPSGAFSSKENIPSGYRKYSVNNFNPAQMKLFKQLFGMVDPNSDTSRLAMGDEDQFNQMEAPALRQFNELQGNIASRFSGQGMGARNSSGFQNTLSSASQDFAGKLQSNRQDLQRQAIMDLMGMSNTLLNQRPSTNGLAVKSPKKPGFLEELGPFFGAVPGFLTGGTSGALKGAKMTANALF